MNSNHGITQHHSSGHATLTGTLAGCTGTVNPAPTGGTLTNGSWDWQGSCNAFSATGSVDIVWNGGLGTSHVTGATGLGNVTAALGLGGSATGGPFGSGTFGVTNTLVNEAGNAQFLCETVGLNFGVATGSVVFTQL